MAPLPKFWGRPGKLPLPGTSCRADTNRKRPLKSSVILCSPASGPSLPLLLLAFYALLMCLGAAALPFPPPLLPLPQPRWTHTVPGTGCIRRCPGGWQERLSPQLAPMAEQSAAPAAEQLGPCAGAPGSRLSQGRLHSDAGMPCLYLRSSEALLLQLLTTAPARPHGPSPACAVRGFSSGMIFSSIL